MVDCHPTATTVVASKKAKPLMARSVKALLTVALVQVSDSCAAAGAKAASSSPAGKDMQGDR